MGKSLLKFRSEAFRRQAARCHYCGVLMWAEDPEAFAKVHRLSPRVLRGLQCTAEHLRARRDGGADTAENIAAACLRCNRLRHQGWKEAPAPETYLQHVQRQLSRRVWHRSPVFERGLIAPC
jgi:5-methylcytosine-specific restriction endonuclease McrA